MDDDMFLNEFQSIDSERKLKTILSTLYRLYETEISFKDSTIEELEKVLQEQLETKERVIKECSFNQYLNDKHYTKIMLICEALRIYLREIAPHRNVRRKGRS